MRCSRVQFAIAVPLLAFSLSSAAGMSSAPSISVQSTFVNVTDFVTPDGQIDRKALVTGKDQDPLKLDGIDVRIDPVSGEPVVRPSAASISDHPDDIYWDNTPSNEINALNGYVSALEVYDGTLIAGGAFDSVGSVQVNGIAAWDGQSWSPLGSGLIGYVDALCVYDNSLIVADDSGSHYYGWYRLPATTVRVWDGLTWSNLGITRRGYTKSILVFDDKLFIDWVTRSGVCYGATSHVENWDGNDWQRLTDLSVETSNSVVYDGRLFVGGWDDQCSSEEEALYGILESWDGSSWHNITANPVYALAVYQNKLYAVIRRGWPGQYFFGSGLAVWDGQSWSPLGDTANGYIHALGVYDNKLIAAGDFTSIGDVEANHIAIWDGDSWSAMGSGTDAHILTMAVYKGNLVVGGSFATAGGKNAPNLAIWTKHDVNEVTLDIKPGSCTNPINGNSAHGQGKAVLPVAIMGTADFDVHDIDPTTVTLNGTSPVRWNYEDVGAPPDDPDEECACSEAGPDGYTDLNLKFYSAEVVASLGGDNVVRVEGQLYDGTLFEGQDCVTLVGRSSSRAVISDLQEREFKVFGNKPNPFNPSTQISFYLPEAANVKLEIFNILGQHVSTLIDLLLEAGEHSVTWNAAEAASGIYYYRLQAGDNIATDKMLLLK